MIPAAVLALVIGLDRPVILEGSVPLATGKPPVRVQVVLLSGGITDGGCSGGFIYTGRFAVVVTPSEGVPVESDLNALLRTDEVSFPAPPNSDPWPIHFADLNGDGKPDFAIAPHFCGNNGRYSLFTIYPHGRVGRIPVVPEDPLIFDDAPSSPSLRAVPGGFEAALYDNSTGSGTTRTYRWDDSHWAFALVRPNGDPHVIVSTENNAVSAGPPPFSGDSGLIKPLPEGQPLTARRRHPHDSLVVAEATLDVNGDSRPDTIQVVMVRGEKYVDAEPSCHMSYGGTPWYRGQFVVRVQLAGQKAAETEIGILFGKDRTTFEFNGSGWPLVFQDLNHDGRLEFTLGQYATCNGSEYVVLGIDSTGLVSALSPTIYAGGHTGSTDVLHPTERGFRFSTPYSASTMSYACTEFEWHAKEGRFIEGATLPEPCSEDEHGDSTVKE